MKRNNAWNIKRLVAGSFGQTNQQSSVLYHKLTNFYTPLSTTLFSGIFLALALRCAFTLKVAFNVGCCKVKGGMACFSISSKTLSNNPLFACFLFYCFF